MFAPGGMSAPGEVSAPGGCLLPGGVCSRGCVCSQGGVCSRGVSALRGVSAQGVCWWGGCIPAYTEADTPAVNSITDVCKNITLAQLHCGQ